MPKNFEIDFLEDYTQETLLKELKRVQSIIGDHPITKKDIDQYGKASWSTYFKKFGSFSKALLMAGLKTSRRMNVTDKELIDTVVSLWTQTLEKDGRRPYASDLKKYGFPFSQDTYRRRFGSWKKVLVLVYNSVDKSEIITLETPNERTGIEVKKTTREEISIRKRFLVFKRDQFTCVLCGRAGMGIKLEVDHRIPVAKGGSNAIENLQTLCFECNRGKRVDTEQ